MEIVLVCVIIILLAAVIYLYLTLQKTLKRLDEMLDSAINGTFSEREFTELKLSKIEGKMQRYLTAGEASKRRVTEERNGIQTLVSDISHQTKTPISNIMLYTELLGEKREMDKGARELISQVKNQAEKLNFLVQSLVKTSRLENGIVSVEPKENPVARLWECLDGAAEAEQKGVDFVVEEIPEATAVFDLKWTAEALSNIVDNAIKYTPWGGKVTVSAAVYEMFVKIEVADTGIGIAEEETAKIFARFYRSPAVSEEKGVGIGLYLAREIIAKQGGYIRVASEVGKGSVFSVFLPRQQAQRQICQN